MGKEALNECLVFFKMSKEGFSSRKLSFEEFKIHEIFITADRSAWPDMKRHQAAKFFRNFQVHFVEKITYLCIFYLRRFIHFEIGLRALI